MSTPEAPSPLTPWPPVPILMYHSVENKLRAPKYKHFYVLAREFIWQMHALKRAGYEPLTFDQLADALQGQSPLPRHPILLTFDDGYLNLTTNVHPLLLKLKFPYTVFLVSEKVGRTNDWVAAEGYEPTPLLDWPEILRMQADGGVSFQAHTATHPRLAEIPHAAAYREMAESRDALEQRLQSAIRVLCYPYGSVSDAVTKSAAEIGYTMGVTTQTGRVRAGDDLLRLPRLSVYHVPPFSLTYGSGALNFWWRVLLWKDKRP